MLQAPNGLYVCFAEVFTVWLCLARVSDVAFGMKVTAQLSVSFVTGFMRRRQAAANARGHTSQLLIGPMLFLSIPSASMSTVLGRPSCSTLLGPWMLHARIVEQNRGAESELIVVMQDRLCSPCKAMLLAHFLN